MVTTIEATRLTICALLVCTIVDGRACENFGSRSIRRVGFFRGDSLTGKPDKERRNEHVRAHSFQNYYQRRGPRFDWEGGRRHLNDLSVAFLTLHHNYSTNYSYPYLISAQFDTGQEGIFAGQVGQGERPATESSNVSRGSPVENG
eukprot:817541-Amorphochlora_amoeboformis.AAC.1